MKYFWRFLDFFIFILLWWILIVVFRKTGLTVPFPPGDLIATVQCLLIVFAALKLAFLLEGIFARKHVGTVEKLIAQRKIRVKRFLFFSTRQQYLFFTARLESGREAVLGMRSPAQEPASGKVFCYVYLKFLSQGKRRRVFDKKRNREQGISILLLFLAAGLMSAVTWRW